MEKMKIESPGQMGFRKILIECIKVVVMYICLSVLVMFFVTGLFMVFNMGSTVLGIESIYMENEIIELVSILLRLINDVARYMILSLIVIWAAFYFTATSLKIPQLDHDFNLSSYNFFKITKRCITVVYAFLVTLIVAMGAESLSLGQYIDLWIKTWI